MADQPSSHEDSNLQAPHSCLRLQKGSCESKAECMLCLVCCFTDTGPTHPYQAARTSKQDLNPRNSICMGVLVLLQGSPDEQIKQERLC